MEKLIPNHIIKQNNVEKDILIESLQYLPEFLQKQGVMKDAAKLLDACLKIHQESFDGVDVLKQIHEAYCDTLYKISGYKELSYAAKTELLKEKGFDYLIKLLRYIYERKYLKLSKEAQQKQTLEQYLEEHTAKNLLNITMLFNLLYILKGKTLGLELALELVNCPPFIYLPWNIVAKFIGKKSSMDDLPVPGDYALLSQFKDKLQQIIDNGQSLNTFKETADALNLTEQQLTKYLNKMFYEWKHDPSEDKEPWKDVFNPKYSELNGQQVLQLFDNIDNCKVEKGHVYFVQGKEIQEAYIFNGVAWHFCADYTQYTTRRQQFTAELIVWQEEDADTKIQVEIADFVRYYMLPYIEVKVQFTADVRVVKCFPSGDKSMLQCLNVKHYYEDRNEVPQRFNEQDLWKYVYDEKDQIIGVVYDTYLKQLYEEINKELFPYADGQLIEKDLKHDVSKFRWLDAEDCTEITLGKPSYQQAFQGIVDLNNSYLERDGVKKYLYGQEKTIPEFIIGDALQTLNDGKITFNNTYVQAPLQEDYVLVNIKTGNQVNPTYSSNGLVLDRDTIIKYNTCILVEGVHQARTVEEMGFIHIQDFDRYLDEEVWAGRTTNVELINPAKVMSFQTKQPYTREKCGTEETVHLKFTDAFAHDYTGIGDLGILGSNTYFIYNGMLFKNENNDIKQIGDEETWTDIGASHAVSETYFTPGIKNGKLVYVKNDDIHNLERDPNSYNNYKSHVELIEIPVEVVDSLHIENLPELLEGFYKYLDLSYWDEKEESQWTHVTGYINEYYTSFGICDGRLYAISLVDDTPHYKILDEEQGWTYITGAFYSSTYNAYGIKNGRLYILSDKGFTLVCEEGIALEQWDSSFDCISRYHHNNEDYITYGICGGSLYGIVGENATKLDADNTWTAVCGYYNNNSPRTYGYAIKDEKLYELQGTDIVLKNDTYNWTDISGCTTATNNFVLGIADSNLYMINKTKLDLIDTDGWTDVFGRYTTSTAAANNCFGYGIKNGRLHILHKDILATQPAGAIVPGMWKKDGIGAAVNLEDYDITNIGIRITDGMGHETIIHDIETVRTSVPVYNEPESTYDIDVTYTTWGFEDNENYLVKTTMSNINNLYIDPQYGRLDEYGNTVGKRANTYTDNCDWNIKTGQLDNFTNCPLTIHGNCKINGNGDAYEFSKDMYLEIPQFTTNIITEFENYDQNEEITAATFKVGAIIQLAENPLSDPEKLYPIILDENGDTGIYYGFQPASTNAMYGIFAKDKDGNYTRLKAPTMDPTSGLHNVELTVTYTKNGDEFIVNGVGGLKCPKYLGGNGNIAGDGIVFLLDSTVTVNKVKPVIDPITKWNVLPLQYQEIQYPLYENGKYFSIETIEQNLEERIITPESQESQKVIEIRDNDKKVIELEMDMLYTTRSHETNAPQLEISDDYAYKKLHYGYNEGIEKSTLLFDGEYTLDPEKAAPVGDIKSISGYGIDTVAKNFNEQDYININPYTEDPLVITTGADVENQILLQTEEGSAYTNNYLLTSTCEAVGNRNQAHGVPSGIMYELDTDEPGVVEHTLEYNCEEFKIDTDKIQETDEFEFDSYTAIMSEFNKGQEDLNCIIPMNLQLETSNNQTTTYSVKPILNINTADVMKQKIMQLGFEEIYIGTKETKYYDSENNEILDIDAFLEEHGISTAPEQEEEFEEFDEENQEQNEEEQNEEPLYTTEIVDIPGAYPIQENTNYYFKFDIKRDSLGLQHITEHATTSTEQKDKFVYVDGAVHNFSHENYFITQNLKQMREISIQFTTDDDASKDQGLFGFPNGQSVCIKDNQLCLCDNTGKVIETYYKVIRENRTFSIVFAMDSDAVGDFEHAIVYYKDDDTNSTSRMFENEMDIQDNMWIGFASAGTGMLPFNGTVDLTQSYVWNGETTYRLYNFKQTTKIYISEDGVNYNEFQTLETLYSIKNILLGYDFNGTLDLYKSDLLLPYQLGWLEDRISIDTVIKERLAADDPTYDPEMDTNTYTIKEYGIHLEDRYNVENPPQRWDVITTTYNTVDHAYYMEPNTKYYIKMETMLDENGVYLLTQQGHPTWNSGIVSFENGYYSIMLDDEKYLVLDTTTTTIEDQTLCRYAGSGSQRIEIKDGKWQYYNSINYYPICDAQPNTRYIFKIPHAGMLQYSTDGENWNDIIETTFVGYDIFYIGMGFKGTLNLNTSYTITDTINYLFTLYKKIMPYISKDGINWKPLTLEPLLTIHNMISFGQGFNGTLQLYESNLLLEDSAYWTANKINVYANKDMPEDNILKDELVRSVIRDAIVVNYTVKATVETKNKLPKNPYDIISILENIEQKRVTKQELQQIFGTRYNELLPFIDQAAEEIEVASLITMIQTDWEELKFGDIYEAEDTGIKYVWRGVEWEVFTEEKKYWTEDVRIKINPEDLKLHVTGLPCVGDKITLTYDTKYLFGKLNHEYDFRITYKDRCVISYYDLETEQDFVLYETDCKNYLVNTGYNFWGTLSVKDSKRNGLALCEHLAYRHYDILYKKQTDPEYKPWEYYTSFEVEAKYNIYVRTGFELNGPLYMESSYVKLGNLVTPFLASWNSNLMTVVGGVTMTDGYAKDFTDNDYLLMKKTALQDGDIVSFDVILSNLENQGIASSIYLRGGIVYSDKPLLKMYEHDRMCIQYHVHDGKISVRMIGNNISNYHSQKSMVRQLTILPYNMNRLEGQPGYYVTTEEEAADIQVFYRIGNVIYDHYTPPELNWYPLALRKAEKLNYYGTTIENVYIADVTFGYTYDNAMNATNHNPHGLEYLENDTIEYKIVSRGVTTYNNTSMYANRVEKQKTVF